MSKMSIKKNKIFTMDKIFFCPKCGSTIKIGIYNYDKYKPKLMCPKCNKLMVEG